ncbi:MAG TPA: DUF1622 domain-containing protein [Nitrospirota bacterium]|nr:DUF1622 domain-containing protein [Nitrospirota bacterium]
MKGVLGPTLDRVIILAFIVGIRVVVGYSLNQELKELPPASEYGRKGAADTQHE